MNKPTKLYKALKEMTGKRSVKKNLIFNNENKDTINFPRVIADMFNKKFVNFATTVEGPTKQNSKNVVKVLIIMMTICLTSSLM